MGPCAEAYAVQFRTCQGVKKENQVASSSKWVLVEKVVLRLMECLPPIVSYIFMSNYSSSFPLLTHLGVKIIRTTRLLNKNRLFKCNVIWDKQCKKWTWSLWIVHIKIKAMTVVGCNDNREIYIASKSCEPMGFVIWFGFVFLMMWSILDNVPWVFFLSVYIKFIEHPCEHDR